jgi:hypothetical protein
LLQAISNTDKHRVRITFFAEIPIDAIELTVNGPLDVARARPVFPEDALVGTGMDLYELPLPDAPNPHMRARVKSAPDVCFLLEDFGMVRVRQLPEFATEMADVLGHLTRFFPPLDNLVDRLEAFAVPEPSGNSTPG